MFAVLKIAGMSAVLSAGLVSAFDATALRAPSDGPAKLYTERAPSDVETRLPIVLAAAGTENATPAARVPGRGDRLVADASSCRHQAWPYVAADCMAEGDASRRAVRTITVGQPDGSNGTTLSRVPASR